MTIRLRITLLAALMFLSIFSIGGFAVYQSKGSATEVKTVTESIVPSALASADLVSQLKDVQLATLVLIDAPDLKFAADAKEKLSAKKKLLEQALEQQAKGAASQAQKGLLQQAQESKENYFASIDTAVKFKVAGKNELAQATLFGNVVQYQGELESIVEILRVEKNRAKDKAIESLNQNLSTTAKAVLGVTIFAVLVLSAAVILLYRKITVPIGRMQAMMSDIATSQDFTRRVPVDTMDEIGHSIVAFNGMIEKIQESSLQLRQRTADIHAMLQNMPQGILTVVQGVKVHPEYSAYVETILETKRIAGFNVVDLVFSGADIGADAIAQLDAAIHACLGEDVMNFEFNKHLLIGEIEKRMPDGRVKILDLSWSPITDAADTTVRLMLCIRDVTELRKLAAEAGEQKRKLEIIGEILAVPQEKFHEFTDGALQFVDENNAIVREHAELNAEAVAKLFRNMHTIKGNARTYGLHHLTNVVHLAEQAYDDLRNPDAGAVWNQERLLSDLGAVKGMVQVYADINDVSLGRKGPGRRGNVDRYLLVDRDHIRETLHRLEKVNSANIHELLAAHDAVRKTLSLLGTEPIAETLAGVLDSLPSLARELDKEPPLVRIVDNDYWVRCQAGGLLKNVFMHLMRNALDHGLETPEVRKLQNKSAVGTITLNLSVRDGLLQMELQDDGRGMALSRIRKLAIEKGLLSPDADPSDEQVARLIFLPGFSTASRLSEVSGRGVGMDAVVDFLAQELGGIEIRFTDDCRGADYRRFKTVISLPESFAVHCGEAATDAADRIDRIGVAQT